jgi:hypothetical protein
VTRGAVLYCPTCGAQHIDKGTWAEKNYSRHLCQYCSQFVYTSLGVKRGATFAELDAARWRFCKPRQATWIEWFSAMDELASILPGRSEWQ